MEKQCGKLPEGVWIADKSVQQRGRGLRPKEAKVRYTSYAWNVQSTVSFRTPGRFTSVNIVLVQIFFIYYQMSFTLQRKRRTPCGSSMPVCRVFHHTVRNMTLVHTITIIISNHTISTTSLDNNATFDSILLYIIVHILM